MPNKDDEEDAGPVFKVTVEDCKRWAQRLHRMAKSLEQKEGKDHPDGIKMFYTASVLMQRLSDEIQEDAMLADIPNPFNSPMGEC
jgi:hypothetical protein